MPAAMCPLFKCNAHLSVNLCCVALCRAIMWVLHPDHVLAAKVKRMSRHQLRVESKSVQAALYVCFITVSCAVSCCHMCSIVQVLGAKVKLMSLQESLLELETDTVEVVAGLVTEFDRSYSEMAEANKLQYNAYFTQVCCAAAVKYWTVL